MPALPAGFVSIAVIEREGRVQVHRARRELRGDGEWLVAVSDALDDRDANVRFRDEVRALDAALAGPGYAPIEGVWFEPSRAIAVPLANARLPVERRELLDVLALLDPIARTLARAHARGVGHGALSPARIMLGKDGPHLADLAIAATMGLARTPEYSAPEQLDAHATKVARADVYALALLFITFAAGRSPWVEERELYLRSLDRLRRPSLGALGILAAAPIDRVLERALSVDAELRFADAGVLWEALRAVVLAAPRTEPEPPMPRVHVEPQVERVTRPPRAPASIVIGTTVALIATGFGLEASVRALRRPPAQSVAASAAPPAATPSPAPSPVVTETPEKPKAMATTKSEMVAVGDAFLVDRTEVTVRSYRACVLAGKCTETHKRASGYRADDPVRSEWLCNYHRAGREDHPVNCIDFSRATAYCAYAGKRLPTAEEWRRAAQGDDGRKYAWGNSTPRCREVVFARYGPNSPGCSKQPVGTRAADAHPETASPYGALDMGGSLWEWTTELSPRGFPVLRGGAWDCSETGVTVESRLEQAPSNADITLGARCVADAPAAAQ